MTDSSSSGSSSSASSTMKTTPTTLIESKCIDSNEDTYPVELFLPNSILEHLKCELCGDILSDATQIMCIGEIHTCCKLCSEDVVCPFCKETQHNGPNDTLIQYSEEKHTHDDRLEKIISELEVKCKFQPAGCRWTGKLKELYGFYGEDNHLSKCEYNIIKCSNGECKEIIRGNDRNEHNKTCSYFVVKCDCGQSLRRKDLPDHLKNDCKLALVNCKLCNASVKRNSLAQHLQAEVSGVSPCPEVMVDCEYKKYGCGEQIKRKDVQSHNSQAALKHMNLRIKTVDKIQLDQKYQLKISTYTKEEKITILGIPYLISLQINTGIVIMTNLGTSPAFLKFDYRDPDGRSVTVIDKFEPNSAKRIITMSHLEDFYNGCLTNIEQWVP